MDDIDNIPGTIDLEFIRIKTTDFDLGGADDIFGNAGDDIAMGGSEGDNIIGDNVESVPGSGVFDKLEPNPGEDILIGDQGQMDFFNGLVTQIETTDTAEADGGVDYIQGNDLADIIMGGVAGDVLHGEAEDKILVSTGGPDVILGDEGLVRWDFGSGETLASASEDGIDADPDAHIGDDDPNTLDLIETGDTSLGGNDWIFGNDSADTAVGGVGNDMIYGDLYGVVDLNTGTSVLASSNVPGTDWLIGDGGRITFFNTERTRITTKDTGDGGQDVIEGNEKSDTVIGGMDDDTLYGEAAPTSPAMIEDDDDDVILGDNGFIDYDIEDGDPSDIDRIWSLAPSDGGVDIIVDVEGSDIIIGGTAGDNVTAGDGNNIVLGDSGRITAAVEDSPRFSPNVPLTVGSIETIAPDIGGSDTITSGTGYDILFGGDKGDSITVSDIYNLVFTDHNIVLGDNGLIDYVRAERDLGVPPGADTDSSDIDLIESTATYYAGGIDTIISGDGQDIIIGGRFGDTIIANHGDNLVIGDSGQIVAAMADTVQQFVGQPMTAGIIETIQPDDGGEDIITTGDDNDIILGGFDSDTIVAGGDDDYVLGDNGLFQYDQHEDNVADLARPDVVDHLGSKVLPLDNETLPDPRTLDLVMTTAPTHGDDDVIYGNDGNDVIFGGTGRDKIWGDNDNDNFNDADGDGADLIFGDHSKIYPSIDDAVIDEDFLEHPFDNPYHDPFFINNNFFSINTQEINGADTEDVPDGVNDFEDIIFGSGNDDTIIGGQDDDILFGGEDNDILIGGHNVLGGNDEIDDMDQALQDAILSGVLANRDASDINDVNDVMDGDGNEDVMAGDNAIIIRQNDYTTSFLLNSQSPRYQQLNDTTVIYSMDSETLGGLYDVDVGFSPNIEGIPQLDPESNVGYFVILLNHSEGIATAAAQSPADPQVFGNDVMAGGAHNDEMFGQLGDDIMQGDGSIEMITDTTQYQMPDNETPFDPSPAVDPSFVIPDNQSVSPYTYFEVSNSRS